MLAELAWDLPPAKTAYRQFLSAVAGKNVPRSNAGNIFMFPALMSHEYRMFPVLEPECAELDPEMDVLRSKMVERFHELFVSLQAQSECDTDTLAIPEI